MSLGENNEVRALNRPGLNECGLCASPALLGGLSAFFCIRGHPFVRPRCSVYLRGAPLCREMTEGETAGRVRRNSYNSSGLFLAFNKVIVVIIEDGKR